MTQPSDYRGPTNAPQAAPASNGGKLDPKPLPYSAPVGPSNINDSKTPGIHGTNHGNAVTQGRH